MNIRLLNTTCLKYRLISPFYIDLKTSNIKNYLYPECDYN
jgi:hypothetical protein